MTQTAKVFRFDEPGSKVLREWNAKRQAGRVVAPAPDQSRAINAGVRKTMRGFAGAAIDRLTASLSQMSNAVNADLDSSLIILRARARSLAANNEFGRRFLSMLAANVVGAEGPRLQVRAKQGDGKLLDKVGNDMIELAWDRWCQQCDVTGRMDLAQLQRVALKSVARDGECLVRVKRGRELPNGLQLQILEADRLAEDMNVTLSNGNVVRMGVEMTQDSKPVAYYIKASHPGENWQQRPPMVERVIARDVYHIYLPERAEQVRGYTWFHAILRRMAMLGDFEEAAVVAAQVGAKKMGVFTRSEDSAPNALATVADANGSNGEFIMSAEAGEFMELPPGYNLESWNPEYPHANFQSFMNECKRGLAVGLDVAAHNLTGNMNEVNYSSARIAELAERDMWITLQNWWVRSFVMPLYKDWLNAALIRGEIVFPASGKSLPVDKYAKFIDASRFQGRRWDWVDPAKEIDAAARMIELGLESRTAIAASKGREFDDVLSEIAQEEAEAKAAGVTLSNGTKPASNPTPAPQQPEQTK